MVMIVNLKAHAAKLPCAKRSAALVERGENQLLFCSKLAPRALMSPAFPELLDDDAAALMSSALSEFLGDAALALDPTAEVPPSMLLGSGDECNERSQDTSPRSVFVSSLVLWS